MINHKNGKKYALLVVVNIREFSFCIRLFNSVIEISGIVESREMNLEKLVVNPH